MFFFSIRITQSWPFANCINNVKFQKYKYFLTPTYCTSMYVFYSKKYQKNFFISILKNKMCVHIVFYRSSRNMTVVKSRLKIYLNIVNYT